MKRAYKMSLTFILSLSIKSHFNNIKFIQAETYQLMFLILLEIKKFKIMQKENTYLENEEDSEIIFLLTETSVPKTFCKRFYNAFFSFVMVINMESEILFFSIFREFF